MITYRSRETILAVFITISILLYSKCFRDGSSVRLLAMPTCPYNADDHAFPQTRRRGHESEHQSDDNHARAVHQALH